jgi:hypothetical protein
VNSVFSLAGASNSPGNLSYCFIAAHRRNIPLALPQRSCRTIRTEESGLEIARRFINESMSFQVVSGIAEIEAIATGRSIREHKRLRKVYGPGRWRKLKGVASIRLANGRIHLAELHWYEAHGIGRKEIKIKRILA